MSLFIDWLAGWQYIFLHPSFRSSPYSANDQSGVEVEVEIVPDSTDTGDEGDTDRSSLALTTDEMKLRVSFLCFPDY